MRRRALVLFAAGCAAACSAGGNTRPPAARLPPLEAAYPLPPLPQRSPRTASYTIDARLDTTAKTLEGSLELLWTNPSTQPVSRFPFHLYWNAFRNNLSTSARATGDRAPRFRDARDFGMTQVRRIALARAGAEEDLLPSLRYVRPDDGNEDDRTLMEVEAAAPVRPGELARFRIEWTGRIPHGCVGRTGWIHDYFFVAQWFPKIAARLGDAWSAHQFHAQTEFFADYGNYDVRLTLPEAFVVGATGVADPALRNGDGTRTLRFRQEDVHDFAWTASPRFMERAARFDDAGYPPVAIRLLVQPEHAHLAERYLEATKVALRAYGAWSAPYPYGHVTVVDPPWFSASGGMEYPTLFTGGAQLWSPPALRAPEAVTVHEAGHQFWYGLVGTNEFEEAWLDEGFNDYHETKAMALFYGPAGWGRRYFGGRDQRGRERGIPIVAPGVRVGRAEDFLSDLRKYGRQDVMARPSYTYSGSEAYSLNSYRKPALVLQTLENLIGDEAMTQILRLYARRYRFGHPTTSDFIACVNEVTGRDYGWFFDETFSSSDLVDYAVEVRTGPARRLEGFTDGLGGGAVLVPPAPGEPALGGPFDSSVTVRRLGEARLPVELLVDFEGGARARESWDGRERWTRFQYRGAPRVLRAVVDPGRKLALDVDPANNSWVAERGAARRAATKWAARFLLWLQHLLELELVLF